MPLPPLGVDTYRRWAADRWRGVTDATIGRVQSGLWDVQASSAIDALGQQLAQMRAQDQARQEAQRQQEVERRRREEEEAVRRREALSATAQGAAGAIGGAVGAGLSGVRGRAATALSGARDWTARADAAIDDLGGQLTGGFAGAQAAPLPTLEAPSTYEPSTPLEHAGALASRLPRAAAQPFQDITRRVQQSSAGTSGALQGFGVPEGLADVAGFGVGALSVPGAIAGSSVQSAAERAGLPEAQLQGDIADILAPFPGSRLGALTRPRVAGLLAGPAIGGTAGALLAPTADGTAPELEDRLRGGLKGAALGLSVGPDVADLATGVPYVFGKARELPGRLGGAARAEAGVGERVVPPSVVAGLPYDVRLPTDPDDLRILTQSNSVRLTPQGVEVDLERYQKPLQAGQPVSRESVFYSPVGGRGPSYRHTEPDAPEGGPQGIRGVTVFKRPLVVERSGEGYGNAPPTLRKIYPGRNGQERATKLMGSIDRVTNRLGGVGSRDEVARVLQAHGGFQETEARSLAEEIIRFTPRGQGNMARYPIADAVAAKVARDHGYDGILYARGGNVQEAIDVREAVYPGPRGEFATRELGPHFQAGDPALRGGAPSLAPAHVDALRGLHDEAVAAEAAGQQAIDDAIARLRAAKADFAARNPPDPATGRLRPNFHVLQDAEPAVGDAQAAWQRAVADQRGAALVRSSLRRVLDAPGGANEVRQGETFLRDALEEARARFDDLDREAGAAGAEAARAENDVFRANPNASWEDAQNAPDVVDALRRQADAVAGREQAGVRARSLENALAEPFGAAGGQALADAREAATRLTDEAMAAGRQLDAALQDVRDRLRAATAAGNPPSPDLATAIEADPAVQAARAAEQQARYAAQAARDALEALEQNAPGRHVTEAVPESGFHVLDLHAPLADPAQHRRLVEAVPPDARQGFLTEAQANARHQGGLTGQGATVAIQAGLRTAGYDPTTLSVYDVLYASGVDALTTRSGAVKPLSEMTDGDRAASIVKVEAAGGSASRPPGAPPATGSSVRTGTGAPTPQTGAPSAQGAPTQAAALLPGGEASRPGLLGIARAAVEPLGARGALTGGERAFDVAAGTAGGVAGAATADEDATWQERLGRGLAGASLGALGGANVRQLGRIAGRAATDGETLGIAAGAAGPTTTGRSKLGDVVSVAQAVPLASPRSLATNAVGGALRTLQRFGQDTLGAPERPTEAIADVVGMGRSLPDAVARFRREMGGISATAGRGQGIAAGGLESAAGFWPRLLTVGTRANAATDRFWRTLNEGGAAGRLAQRLGVSVDEVDPLDLAEVTQRGGDFATFLGPNSPIADALVTGAQWARDTSAPLPKRLFGATLAGFAPYVRTPERILGATLSLATDPVTRPAAFVRALKRGDEFARREAQGRFLLATPIMAAAAAAYLDGTLRGAPPQNPTERRRQEAQGARWNTWAGIPLRQLGNLGQAAGALATTLAAAERGVLRGEAPADVVRDGVNAFARWALSESYLDDLVRFGTDVSEGRASQAIERQGASMLTRPLSPLTGVGAALDPAQRTREGTGEELLYGVPGGRFLLPERLDPTTGEPVRRRGTPGSRYWLGDQGVETSPEGAELSRYGVNAPEYRAGQEYRGARLTGPQARALQRASGSEANRAVRETVATPEYRQADDAGKERLLRAALTRARERADAVVGEAVARDPLNQARRAWDAVPKYRGVEGTPDEVRAQNDRIARAKAARSAAARKGREAESAWVEAHPEEYELARYRDADARRLRLEREQIERQYGVTLS